MINTNFLAALVFFLISLILLIIFCFKTQKDILWLTAVVLFIFGSFLSDDNFASAFFALLISVVMLLIFYTKGNTIYAIAIAFVLIGGITSNILNVFWYLTVPIIATFIIVKKIHA